MAPNTPKPKLKGSDFSAGLEGTCGRLEAWRFRVFTSLGVTVSGVLIGSTVVPCRDYLIRS